MIKIKLIVPKLLLDNKEDIKASTCILHLEYDHPVTVDQVLKDHKINRNFLGFMLIDGQKNVTKGYLINTSCELKLFLLAGGG